MLTALVTGIVHSMPIQFQEHGDQNMRSCLLQRLCRGTAHLSVPQVPQLRQILRQQRSHACHLVIAPWTLYYIFLSMQSSLRLCYFSLTFGQVHGSVLRGSGRSGPAFDEFMYGAPFEAFYYFPIPFSKDMTSLPRWSCPCAGRPATI